MVSHIFTPVKYCGRYFTKSEEENVMTEEILSAVDGQLFAVWFLIGAALVFWMQAGFAMVETGFTRAKMPVIF